MPGSGRHLVIPSPAMSHRCDEPSCEASAPIYYQCSDKKCGHELGFCKAHGGMDRSQDAMKLHMTLTHQLVRSLLTT